jgi:hypothetical protein
LIVTEALGSRVAGRGDLGEGDEDEKEVDVSENLKTWTAAAY